MCVHHISLCVTRSQALENKHLVKIKQKENLEVSKRITIFAPKNINNMDKLQVLDGIKQVAAHVLPKGSALYLYGSRARGDYHEHSDWDLLLIVDKPTLNFKEREDLEFYFTEKGWNVGEDISARAYTKYEWENGPRSMFYYNVEQDKQLIYES